MQHPAMGHLVSRTKPEPRVLPHYCCRESSRARLHAETSWSFISSCKVAALYPPHQIIEIDHELLGPGDVVLKLLDDGAREFGRRIPAASAAS
jgi:hypothetical protein